MGFFNPRDVRGREILPGARQRVLCGRGGRMMMVHYEFKAGTALPVHSHSHEQVGLMLSGAAEFVLGRERRSVSSGEGWTIPGNVPHGATFTQDSIVVEVFSPPREDFLE